MKFGFYISGQQEENGDLHFIDYPQLKKLIKDVVARLSGSELSQALTANTAFEQELHNEILQVNNCFDSKQKELVERIARLAEEFQLAATAGLQPDGDEADAREKQHHAAFCDLVSMLKEVDRLRKFAVWNAVAVVKILKKRRKQTNFGLEDTSAERAGWLSRQSFFSGSEFAALHAAIESLGHVLVLAELGPSACSGTSRRQQVDCQPEQCPICLDTISDMVELGCKHRFCWKCFVLGPVALQGEYRMTQCPICRSETTKAPELQGSGDGQPNCRIIPGVEGMLTRFLHTYFPQSAQSVLGNEAGGADVQDEMNVVGELIKVIVEDNCQWSPALSFSRAACGPQASAMESAGGELMLGPPSDFFQTLPPPKDQPALMEAAAAQKLQWLQLACSNDCYAIDNAMYCSICSEPLLMEAVVTTPCKHHFHQICVKRLEMPQCPLCYEVLPFSWFLPSDHPLVERGFRAVPPSKYRPLFLGGPSKGCHGFTLHRPPPVNLLAPGGLTMRSYLHHIPPLGPGENDVEDSPRAASAPPSEPQSPEERRDRSGSCSSSESSSEESNSEAGFDEAESTNAGEDSRSSPGMRWAYSSLGRTRLFNCDDPERAASSTARSSNSGDPGRASSSNAPSSSQVASGSSDARVLLQLAPHL